MEIQTQVCTLEQAKRLKCLNVIQRSYFSHIVVGGETMVIPTESAKLYRDKIEIYSAFTLSELWKAINWDLVSVSAPYKKDRHWWLMTNSDDGDFHDDNPVIASADSLIYLLERGKVKPEEVNNRLNPFYIKAAV